VTPAEAELLFRALETRATELKVRVVVEEWPFRVLNEPGRGKYATHFLEAPEDRPLIKIFTIAGGETFDRRDPLYLAHEMGHHLRWLSGMDPRYKAHLDALREEEGAPKLADLVMDLPDGFAVVMAEEVAAWVNGWEELTRAGFTDKRTFERVRYVSLGTYCNGLLEKERKRRPSRP
jgi:hypothetical protein